MHCKSPDCVCALTHRTLGEACTKTSPCLEKGGAPVSSGVKGEPTAKVPLVRGSRVVDGVADLLLHRLFGYARLLYRKNANAQVPGLRKHGGGLEG